MQEGFDMNRAKKKSCENKGLRAAVCVLVLVAVIVITAMLTFSLTVKNFLGDEGKNDDFYKKFEVIGDYIDDYAYYDANHEEMMDAALKAYTSGAGDRYTVYYNSEDFKALNEDNEGRYVGIGVTVSVSQVEYLGEILSLVEIIKVHEGSPAYEAGLVAGDVIYSVQTPDGEIFADDVGLDVLSSKIKGEEGTEVTLSVLKEADGDLQKREVTMVRRKVEVKSVSHALADEFNDIGIVTISQFDLNTPFLLSRSIDALKSEGIDKIVIDMRNNGGGDLNSVVACATYFLNENDLIISAENNRGKVVEYKAHKRTFAGSYELCSVSEDEIGKYKDISVVILVNENTASAAELLTAVFRDYDLAPIVGVNTYGKGTMQTIYSLESRGIDGGIKITTDVYFPPCGENYDGVGIMPDVVVELDETAEDNQLKTAIEQLIK